MNLDQRVAFLKELYFFEMARKDQVNASLALPITLATSLAAVVAYYVQNWPSEQLGAVGVVFLIPAIAGIICLICTFCRLALALWGTVYESLPSATALWGHYQTVVRHYERYPNLTPSIDEWLATTTANQLAHCAAKNDAANRARVTHRVFAVRWLLAAVVLFALAMVPYGLLTLQERGPQEVRIVPSVPETRGE